MLTKEIIDKYQPVIGIECHVQLATKSKLFTAINNDAREAKPNTTVGPLCFGLPGTLPVLNRRAVEMAIRLGFALNADINNVISFDRKHYFYPDNPSGYQITQMSQPIILGGHVDAATPEGLKFTVRLHHAHLEADAGKLTHPTGADYSLVDFNRVGTPLVEIVTEPDICSPAEARAFAEELQKLVIFSGAGDANLYYGNMRFDVNVSVKLKRAEELGTRTETKNLNSFKSVEKAAEYEIRRQIEQLEKGERVIQETRGWDEAKQKTFTQRSKEDAHDYRYMPEPDIPPVEISQQWVDRVKSEMGPLPSDIRRTLDEAEIDQNLFNIFLDNSNLLILILSVIKNQPNNKKIAKKIASWLTSDVLPLISGDSPEVKTLSLTSENLIKLESLVEKGSLSSTAAKQVLIEISKKDADPEVIAKALNLIQVSDNSFIEKIVKEVIDANPQAVADIKNGELKAIGFLTGQVMKQSKGQANPALATAEIKRQLGV
jgi:aspartyl-tRNA(Asn)/glutamyl-tRNA(Gln) amidotransferase subunit B